MHWFGMDDDLWQPTCTRILHRGKIFKLMSGDRRWVRFPSSAMYTPINASLCFLRDLMEHLLCD